MSRVKHEIVMKTDVYIAQEEYDKLYQYWYKAKRTPITTIHGDGLVKAAYNKYEIYRIHLSDKYNIELLRSDGSYFACEGLRVVYVLDVPI